MAWQVSDNAPEILVGGFNRLRHRRCWLNSTATLISVQAQLTRAEDNGEAITFMLHGIPDSGATASNMNYAVFKTIIDEIFVRAKAGQLRVVSPSKYADILLGK
jgi:hypothetical protein